MGNGSLFGAVADAYAASRPSYPDQLYDQLERARCRPLAGADALDVGAGTGIATAGLARRGVAVTAVEPDPGMLTQLRVALPGTPAVRASGDALPFRNGCVDLVTYAQSLHWTDLGHSLPEALRVLRPGGVFAAWWNVPDLAVPWVAEQRARIRAASAAAHDHSGPDFGLLLAEPPFGLAVQQHSIPWTRASTVERHLTMLATYSYVVTLPEPRRTALLADERARLAAAFPDGDLAEPYVTTLVLARSPGG